MLTALISGGSLALGHHLFYDSLRGKEAPSGSSLLGLGLSKQQTNIAIGTAFAFATKTCLVVAASTTCIQLFWLRVVTKHSDLKLKSVNNAYSVTGNIFKLLYLSEWRQFPLLFIVALITW